MPSWATGPDIDLRIVAELVQRYTAGENLTSLVGNHKDGSDEDVMVSYRQVRNVLLRAGVTLRPPKILLPPTPPGLVNAYNAGRTIQQLATTHGMSYNQTRRILLAEGVQLRRRGRR